MGELRGTRGQGWRIAALAAASLATLPAAAQVPAPQPVPGQPGQQLPTREELQRVPVAPLPEREARVSIDASAIERAPCPLADPRFSTITVTVQQAQFDGLGPIDPELLRSAYEPYLNRQVPIATICEIRDIAGTILRRAGYLAAVQVPPQTIDTGTVRFDVLLARLRSLRIRGDLGPSEQLVANLLQPLVSDAPFNQNEAERTLLLARDLPGYDIRLTLRPVPGGTPGDVAADVTVQRQRGRLDYAIQNLGSEEVGRFGGLLRGELYDLIGAGDRLTAGVFQTPNFSEQTVLQGSYDAWLGTSGLTAGARIAYAWTRPDVGGGDPFRARTLIAAGQLSYPLVRSQAVNVRATGGLELIDQRLSFEDTRVTTDRLRVGFARIDIDTLDPESVQGVGEFSAVDPRWRARMGIELRKGFDILGARDNCGTAPTCPGGVTLSRTDGDPEATVIRAAGEVGYRVGRQVEFVLAPRGQYAFDPVVTYEEFSIGNFSVGRGYEPGTLVGDSGYGLTFEGRYGRFGARPGVQAQPFAFVDAAWVWDRGANRAFDGSRSLVSVGGGVRAIFEDRARLDATIAVPLDRSPFQEKRNSVRFLVSLNTRLLPWR